MREIFLFFSFVIFLPMVTMPQRARIQTTRRMTPTMMRPSKAMNSIVPHIMRLFMKAVCSCMCVCGGESLSLWKIEMKDVAKEKSKGRRGEGVVL
ncbi:MAG: hypothetical protein J3R72DRAFT_443082, partial [Linnemannia gamsii]